MRRLWRRQPRFVFEYDYERAKKGGLERAAKFRLTDARRQYSGKPGREARAALFRFNDDDEVKQLAKPIDCCQPPRARCGLGACPDCGGRFRERETWKSMRMVTAKAGGIPVRNETMSLTIVGPSVDLKSKRLKAIARHFIGRLRDIRRRHLQATSWLGHLEFSPDRKLHTHVTILHSGMSRADVEAILREHFPPRCIRLDTWHTDKTNFENYRKVMYYQTKFLPQIKVLPGDTAYETLQKIGLCVLSRMRIATAHYVGIRFAINMGTTRRWIGDRLIDRRSGKVVEIPEMTEWARERRNGGRQRGSEDELSADLTSGLVSL